MNTAAAASLTQQALALTTPMSTKWWPTVSLETHHRHHGRIQFKINLPFEQAAITDS